MKKFFAVIVAVILLTTATAFAVALFDTPYIGNSYRHTLHYRDCPSVDQMNPKNQVPFNTAEEAFNQSYHPCGNCRPDIPRR